MRDDDDEECDAREERHPLVARPELADVGAGYEQIAHGDGLPASARGPPAVAACSACDRRKTAGAMAAVAIAWGITSG